MLTIRDPASVGAMAIGVSYDAFVDDVEVRGNLGEACGGACANRSHISSMIGGGISTL